MCRPLSSSCLPHVFHPSPLHLVYSPMPLYPIIREMSFGITPTSSGTITGSSHVRFLTSQFPSPRFR